MNIYRCSFFASKVRVCRSRADRHDFKLRDPGNPPAMRTGFRTPGQPATRALNYSCLCHNHTLPSTSRIRTMVYDGVWVSTSLEPKYQMKPEIRNRCQNLHWWKDTPQRSPIITEMPAQQEYMLRHALRTKETRFWMQGEQTPSKDRIICNLPNLG
jgi:hypothetical protein